MMKQPLFIPEDVLNLFPLQASSDDETDLTSTEETIEEDSFLLRYESKHPESAAAASAYAASLRSSSDTVHSKMVVFDKDGTLGDCTASLRRWVLYMTDKLLEILTGVDEQTEQNLVEDFYQQIGWDNALNDVVPSAPVAAGTWDDIVTLVHQFLLNHSAKCKEPVTLDLARKLSLELGDLHSSDPPVLDDMKEMMEACQRMGYLVAICTSDDRAGTDLAMKSWGIDAVVDISVCGDEVSQGKPSAVPLQVLCQRANKYLQQQQEGGTTSTLPQIRPQDCIVVGDTTADCGMARAAKAGFCVGVLTGSGTTEQLLETGAHLILPHVGHIPALLETLEQFGCSDEKVELQ